MDLFKYSQELQENNVNALIYSTPMGSIKFNFIFNETEIFNIKPSKAGVVDKALITCWDLDKCHAEFLQTDFIPRLSPGMKIDDCVAGIWRVQSRSHELLPSFTISLDSELDGFADPGEGLDCISFESKDMYLFIGTEDTEYIGGRACAKKWMPERFKYMREQGYETTTTYTTKGIQINLPELKQNECIQIHFLIAWALNKMPEICLYDNPPELSCWYAVDLEADSILKAIDIT